MTRTRTALIALLATFAGSLATIGIVAQTSSAAPSVTPAAPTVYSVTYAGTDAHTLDPRYRLMFVDGGGVAPVLEVGQGVYTYQYAEIGVDLPVGAKVTSISVTARNCSSSGMPVWFGSYSPTTRVTQQTAALSVPGGCVPKTVTKTGNPIVTTVAGRRYALDPILKAFSSYPASSSTDVLYGTTIKYTCQSPCVP